MSSSFPLTSIQETSRGCRNQLLDEDSADVAVLTGKEIGRAHCAADRTSG
ncbi:MAG: hypothetical protein MK082_10605 [Phycisphaerales bacterium]|nr:hypothetical protein [Phycisphaerales bacterium]